MIIKTERLVVRPFTTDDAEALHEIFGDPETMQNCEPAYDIEKTRRFLEDFCIGRHGALAAALKETGKLIGYILFNSMGENEHEDVYEIGWIFNRQYWRQGYAFESCKAVVDYAFETLHAHKLFAEAIDPVKSVGLMEKLGMVREGVQRSHTGDNFGGWADLYLYGMLDTAWREQNKYGRGQQVPANEMDNGKEVDYARKKAEI